MKGHLKQIHPNIQVYLEFNRPDLLVVDPFTVLHRNDELSTVLNYAGRYFERIGEVSLNKELQNAFVALKSCPESIYLI